ncbi:MAG: hypothetical protein IT486_09660, partial [Gammaproteobacteria bacterium]|nr:hypothetical protein [Gammaproteobacteria bacterium]
PVPQRHFDLMWATLKTAPEWQARINAAEQQMAAQNAATQDRMHKDTVRTIREVQGYRDPRSGGVVELPQHYDHAWQLRDGSYVLTDDPDFDPRRDVGVAGEKLQRTRE